MPRRDEVPPAGSPPAGLGVFGGAFNPPHQTHVRLARAALAQLPIRELLVLPAGDHPHKRGQDMAPAADRVAMCRRAFAEVKGAVVDERERHRPGPSFTVDTLAELAAQHPGRGLWFLIGSDNLPLLAAWRQPERLLELCTVVTYPRLGYPIGPAAVAALPRAHQERLLANVLAFEPDAISATDLRARWRAGERDLPEVPPTVRDYLAAHGLYR
jgi:nicotinate-nucleotide adenylyltransferase